MVGLLLQKDDTKVIVEVGFFQNDTIPSLQYHFGDWLAQNLDEMNSDTLKEIFKVAEANVKGIYLFDKRYDYDCQATIDNGVTIEKFCCDDETDNPYFVGFPKTEECQNFGECNRCWQECVW